MASTRINLLWIHGDPESLSNYVEFQWIGEMFSSLATHVFTAAKACSMLTRDDAGINVLCACYPNLISGKQLLEIAAQSRQPTVLLNLGDEYIRYEPAVYDAYDLVIRNGYLIKEADFSTPLVQIPAGYVSPFRNENSRIIPAKERKYPWSFLGNIGKSRDFASRERSRMVEVFSSCSIPGVLQTPRTWSESMARANQSVDIIKNSVFVPCPIGNYNPECHRLYEALENGCIPILRKLDFSDYHKDYFQRLLGPTPIPSCRSWSEAVSFISGLLGNPGDLESRQTEIHDWWLSHKEAMKEGIKSHLDSLPASDY